MTINELLVQTKQYQFGIFIYLLAIPILSFIYNVLHKPEERISAPHKYVYSFLIYAASLPGAIGFTLTAYTMFFLRANMLNVNLFIYFLPIASMVASLIIISKETDLKHIPGFDRLIGLFTVEVVAIFCVLMFMKMQIFVIVFASMKHLGIALIIVIAILMWAYDKVFGQKEE